MKQDAQVDNERLLRFLYACPIGLIQANLDGTIETMNPVAVQLLLPIARGMMLANFFEVLEGYAPELRNLTQAFTADIGTVCSGHRVYVGHLPGARNDKPYVIGCTIVKLDGEQLIATVENISEQVAQERRLKQTEAWFASMLGSSEDFAVIGLDASGCIEVLNASARQQTGFSDADLIGCHLAALDSPDAASGALSIADEIEQARRDGWHLADGWCVRHGGGRYRCQRLISVCREEESEGQQIATGYTVILRPASKTSVDSQELRRRLTTDHLTGAYNRAHFFEAAEQERRRSARQEQPLGLVILDIDHFKRINDVHGHAAGDRVLEQVTRSCQAVLRPGDMFARLGGEEFVTLLPMATHATVAALAERMREAISAAQISVKGRDVRVTASFGAAADLSGRRSIKDLLEAADQALYFAKRSGRDRVVLDGEQRAVA